MFTEYKTITSKSPGPFPNRSLIGSQMAQRYSEKAFLGQISPRSSQGKCVFLLDEKTVTYSRTNLLEKRIHLQDINKNPLEVLNNSRKNHLQPLPTWRGTEAGRGLGVGCSGSGGQWTLAHCLLPPSPTAVLQMFYNCVAHPTQNYQLLKDICFASDFHQTHGIGISKKR